MATWSYGITTVPDRATTYLPRTISSLRLAGFERPTLFIDGNARQDHEDYGLAIVDRNNPVGAFGNWIIALWELWIREKTDWYVIFQDDFLMYSNTREYLEKCCLSATNRYYNLHTHPQNEQVEWKKDGWYKSNQRGRGAVALMFPQDVVYRLLSNEHIAAKPRQNRNPYRNLDGTVSKACTSSGITEWCHYPTLTYHIGEDSSLNFDKINRQGELVRQPLPESWKGEEFDALDLLCPENLET